MLTKIYHSFALSGAGAPNFMFSVKSDDKRMGKMQERKTVNKQRSLLGLLAYVKRSIYIFRRKTYLIYLYKHEYLLNFSEKNARKVKREQKLCGKKCAKSKRK